jgi:hypothetical protein
MLVVAVDWSGDATAAGQRRRIWMGLARHGKLVALEDGRDRRQVVDFLIDLSRRHRDLVVGLDFAFSFPAWFLREHGLANVAALWDLVAEMGEQWLGACQPPFWGRPGMRRPVLPEHFRVTESTLPPVAGIAPKSVFQVGGAGAVGAGSLRGMPWLRRLQDAGFSIWPFDAARPSTVVEMYPRALTGAVVKSDAAIRKAYLDGSTIPARLRRLAEQSEDAFDAAISALVMSRYSDALVRLQAAPDPITRLEGSIWSPPSPEPSRPGISQPTWPGSMLAR